jgi:hypothetical protein
MLAQQRGECYGAITARLASREDEFQLIRHHRLERPQSKTRPDISSCGQRIENRRSHAFGTIAQMGAE